MKNLQKKIGKKISLEIPKDLAKIVGANEDNKVVAYIIPNEIFPFAAETQKNYLLIGENGTFLWETVKYVNGNTVGTHINLDDGFPDYIDRYFRELYLM